MDSSPRSLFAELEHRLLQPATFMLHPVHQSLCPDKLCRQQSKPEENNQPARPRSEEHQEANYQQGESPQYSEKPANLIDGTEEHRASGAEEQEPLLWRHFLKEAIEPPSP